MPPPQATGTTQLLDCAGPRKRASSLPAEARRSMIIDAALPLLLAEGDKVTTQEIAAAAEIAEGTIFRVFVNKDELIEAVVDRSLDPAATESALSAIDPGIGLEAAVVEAVRILQRRVAAVWQLLSSVGPRYHRHEKGPTFESAALTELFRRYRTEIDASPAEAAHLLRSITVALTHSLITPEPLPAEKVARRFLHGVAKPC